MKSILKFVLSKHILKECQQQNMPKTSGSFGAKIQSKHRVGGQRPVTHRRDVESFGLIGLRAATFADELLLLDAMLRPDGMLDPPQTTKTNNTCTF